MERHILERYFNNTCTHEEQAQVEQWLSDRKNSEEAKDHITRLWGDFRDEEWKEGADGAPAFDDIWTRISDLRYARSKAIRELPKRRSDRWLYVAAACLGFLITLGTLFWMKQGSSGEEDYVTVQTEKGERKRVTLSDGSEVYLNADSRLVYPKAMDLLHAAIYIEGEAFFNMKESDKPRIIKAGGVEARAGAERAKFNITAFPADSTVTVAVDEGKTEVRSEYGPLLKLRIPGEQAQPDSLTPLTKLRPPQTSPLIKLRPAVTMDQREYAVVHKQRGEVNVSGTLNEKKVFGWKDGILYFEGAYPPEVVSKLERWYGVTINICEDGLPASAYSAEFDNASISNVLAQLSQTLHLRYEIAGKTVHLCGK